jgi:hypothetical protein
MFAGFGSVAAQESLRLAAQASAPKLHALLSLAPILGIGFVLLLVKDYWGEDRRRAGQRVGWGLVWLSLKEEVGLRAAYVASFLTRVDLTIICGAGWPTAGAAARLSCWRSPPPRSASSPSDY